MTRTLSIVKANLAPQLFKQLSSRAKGENTLLHAKDSVQHHLTTRSPDPGLQLLVSWHS